MFLMEEVLCAAFVSWELWPASSQAALTLQMCQGPSLARGRYLTVPVCFVPFTTKQQLHSKINTNNSPAFGHLCALNSPAAHLYHLSH